MPENKLEWKWSDPEFRYKELAMLSLDVWKTGSNPSADADKVGLASFIDKPGGTGF